ncbi:MAG: orotate phosphoribosyltransferase, partial [Rhodobacteraceae bacterium]|nr:orotate phosphoribosyltransferase [Paracoccaceae bacterium]
MPTQAPPAQRVLPVEGLAPYRKSKLSFVRGIRDAEGTSHHAAAMFRYGIFPKAEARLARHEITLSCLCDWWDVLREAQAQG